MLDTSDAREGIVSSRKSLVEGQLIGSQKKVAVHRDVIISRLGPYLRQVAFIDNALQPPCGASILISTEFFMLRPLDERSIAFLVPFYYAGRCTKCFRFHRREDTTLVLTRKLCCRFLFRIVGSSNAMKFRLALRMQRNFTDNSKK